MTWPEKPRANEDVAVSAARASRAVTGMFVPKELAGIVESIASKAGVKEQSVYRAFEAAAPTGRRLGREKLLESIRIAAEYESVFDDPMKAIAPRIAQVSDITGISPEASLGFLTRAKRRLEVKDFTSMMERVAPNLIGATRAGGTMEGAFELASVLQQAQPDIRGGSAKITADVYQRLFQEPTIPQMVAQGRGPAKLEYRTLAQIAPGAETFTDARAAVQKAFEGIPEALREESLRRLLTGSGGARAELRNLYTGDPAALARLQQMQRAVLPPSAADAALVKQALEGAEAIPAVTISLAKDQADASVAIAKRQQTDLAAKEIAMQTLDDLRKVGGAGGTYRSIQGMSEQEKSPQQILDTLEATQRRIETGPGKRALPPMMPLQRVGAELVERLGFGGADYSEMSGQERRTLADGLDRVVDRLDKILMVNEETRRSNEKIANRQQGRQRQPAGGFDVEQ